jgi:hypothetical protein
MGRFFLLLGLALGLAAGLLPQGPRQDVDAGTAVRLETTAELVAQAELVFEGHVRSVRSLLGPGGLIETECTFEVERTFLGEDLGERVVRLPGGVLESGRGLLIPGLPTIVAGEDVLLFLTGPGASGLRMPVGLSQGKFRVETRLDGSRRLSRRHGALTVIDPATGSIEDAGGSAVFDYAELIAEVHAAVASKLAAGAYDEVVR